MSNPATYGVPAGYLPGGPAGNFGPGQGFVSTATLTGVAGSAIAGLIRGYVDNDGNRVPGPAVPAQYDYTQHIGRKPRRRRRRLLTCSDKADIAYLVGQLGTGQLGKSAVSALLSRRCG